MAKLNIISENKNELFNRREIVATLNSEIAPKRADVEVLISEQFSTIPENFLIKHIKGKFGSKTFKVTVNIYDSKENKEKIEFRQKKKKKK